MLPLAPSIPSVPFMPSVARAAGKIRNILFVVANRYVEIRTQIGMARLRDGDVWHLPVADPGDFRQSLAPFVICGDNGCGNSDVFPHHFSLPLTLGR